MVTDFYKRSILTEHYGDSGFDDVQRDVSTDIQYCGQYDRRKICRGGCAGGGMKEPPIRSTVIFMTCFCCGNESWCVGNMYP